MSPTSFSTIAPYSSNVRCERCNGSGWPNGATVDGRCSDSADVITSRRAIASSYAQSTRSSVPFQFTAFAISVMVPSWWSTAGDVGAQQQQHVRQPGVVGDQRRQPLQPADHVVGKEADQATGQRRQA